MFRFVVARQIPEGRPRLYHAGQMEKSPKFYGVELTRQNAWGVNQVRANRWHRPCERARQAEDEKK